MQSGHGFPPGCSARALGWGVPLLRPPQPAIPSHPQLPYCSPRPRSPQPASAGVRRDRDGELGCNLQGEAAAEALRCQPGPPRFTCGPAGSGLGSAARVLRRRRGLQLQWRRRRWGAFPSSDSRRSAPRPPAHSWPGSRDRGVHPRPPRGLGAVQHHPGPGRRGCSAALGLVGEDAWRQQEAPRGRL